MKPCEDMTFLLCISTPILLIADTFRRRCFFIRFILILTYSVSKYLVKYVVLLIKLAVYSGIISKKKWNPEEGMEFRQFSVMILKMTILLAFDSLRDNMVIPTSGEYISNAYRY